ncbi:hypothetical protein J3E07_001651 [Methanococcus voltae]|uniref:Uncharacterized protein n=1 Tax=Methanococcus voltae TaxID=2188 RepID=A0A8J7RIS4_METVO|nr:hypothetical protein [Methanococcus voltae]MBP2202210.1 hypothetical protein [Methanococcus voltae]
MIIPKNATNIIMPSLNQTIVQNTTGLDFISQITTDMLYSTFGIYYPILFYLVLVIMTLVKTKSYSLAAFVSVLASAIIIPLTPLEVQIITGSLTVLIVVTAVISYYNTR